MAQMISGRRLTHLKGWTAREETPESLHPCWEGYLQDPTTLDVWLDLQTHKQ